MIKKKKNSEVSDQFEEIEIELEDKVFIYLALEAHKQNITFNQYINNLLKEFLDKLNKDKKNV